MTRINLVPPELLTDQHLLAELRELPRIFTFTHKHPPSPDRVPSQYCLGSGHVLFFTNKLRFLIYRYMDLCLEAQWRGFKFTTLQKLPTLNPSFFQDWEPSTSEIQINLSRLSTKVAMKPQWYKYHSQSLPAHIQKFYNI